MPANLGERVDSIGVWSVPTRRFPNGRQTVPAGTTVQIAYTVASPVRNNFVGIYTVGESDVNNYLVWRYTNGDTAGIVYLRLPANLATGSYEVRLYRPGSPPTLLATGNTIQVQPFLIVLPRAAQPGDEVTAYWAGVQSVSPNHGLGLYLCDDTDDSHNLLPALETIGSQLLGARIMALPTWLDQNLYEYRLLDASVTRVAVSDDIAVARSGTSIEVNPTVPAPGGSLQVKWKGLRSPNGFESIRLTPIGVPNDRSWLTNQDSVPTGGVDGAATVTIDPLATPGLYELTWWTSYPGGHVITRSPMFNVGNRVYASANLASPGCYMPMGWSDINLPSTADFITLNHVNDALYNWPFGYILTNATAQGSIPQFQLPNLKYAAPGQYEFRLYRDEASGSALKSRSQPFTVMQPHIYITGYINKPGGYIDFTWDNLYNAAASCYAVIMLAELQSPGQPAYFSPTQLNGGSPPAQSSPSPLRIAIPSDITIWKNYKLVVYSADFGHPVVESAPFWMLSVQGS